MNVHPNLYNKLAQVSKEVKNTLRKKGLTVPTYNEDGSITMGSYVIIKVRDGTFKIVSKDTEVLAENINLPQTAIMVANRLAITRNIDSEMLILDKLYGGAFFEESLTKRALTKNRGVDHWDLMTTKNNIAKARKLFYKNQIVNSYRNFENSYK